MAKKFLVCGKGGAGKSTLAALIARILSKRGRRIFLVDADESNIGLYRMLDLEYPKPLMDYLGGKTGFREKTKSTGLALGGPPPLFPKEMDIDRLPGECVAQKEGISVLSVGKIQHFGEGCACPMGNLFRLLFSSLKFPDKTIVIIDTAAGIEHFGRRLDSRADYILCILDPSYESLVMARKVKALAKEAGLGVSFILNKLTAEAQALMAAELGDADILGQISSQVEIGLKNLKGQALDLDFPEIHALCDAIEKL